MNTTFLTADWRYLAMVNFAIDPAVLQPLVPPGTELDFHEGRTYVSIVGFRFLTTRVCGVCFPFHRDFEEVNLRFYVRRRSSEGWRRGVVFIRELVPRWAIAFIARTFYGEPYLALPMRHRIEIGDSQVLTEYGWRRAARWESVRVIGKGQLEPIESGSMEEFITEHYWGYTARGAVCSEYEVEHPRWRIWPGVGAELDLDVASLYGAQFVEALSVQPASCFIAEGSPIAVRRNSNLSLAECLRAI